MTNIWGFFIQTAELSLVAAMLLIIKGLLTDKLSPRWQYGVWSVFFVKAVIPAGALGSFFMFYLAAWLQGFQTMAERGLDSAYIDPYARVGDLSHTIPYLKAIPASITDWLFVLYLAGVIFFLLRYVLRYARLRTALSKGFAVSQGLQRQIDETAQKYGLKSCKAVVVGEISSAFVCGVIAPVMAVPKTETVDEKIILHELLHLRYKDNLQNLLWFLLRALHWCNPFLQYVFDRIGNDMESLCDQRVLERLEGEERRAYGRVLLAMTSEKYARAPGTTSVSNGGKNIGRRIEAIARFKKYPKGMALVSLCIGVVLFVLVLKGDGRWDYAQEELRPSAGWTYESAMAKARVRGCTTPAGAVDTWAKGMAYQFPAYVAAATPTAEQKDFETKLSSAEESFSELVDARRGNGSIYYELYSLKQIADKRYDANLVFYGEEIFPEDEEANRYHEALVVPISIWKEHRGWVVSAAGEKRWTKFELYTGYEDCGFDLPMTESHTIDTDLGKITISMTPRYLISGVEPNYGKGGSPIITSQTEHSMSVDYFIDEGFEISAYPDAVFDEVSGWVYKVEFENELTAKEQQALHRIGFGFEPLMEEDEDKSAQRENFELNMKNNGGNFISASGGGYAFGQSADLGFSARNTDYCRWEYGVEQYRTLSMKDFWGWELWTYQNDKDKGPVIKTYKLERGKAS